MRVGGHEIPWSRPAREFRVLGMLMRNLQHCPRCHTRDNRLQMMLPDLCLNLRVLCTAIKDANRITNRRALGQQERVNQRALPAPMCTAPI